MANYSPVSVKYKELWAKYGSCPPIILTQETSVYWSVKLHKTIEAVAKEKQRQRAFILARFIKGVLEAKPQEDKLRAGLSAIGSAEELIQSHGLFFRFNDLDDLFLLDEPKKNGVMLFE